MSISTTFPVPSTKSDGFLGRRFSPLFLRNLREICGEVDDASNKMPQKMWIQLLCFKKQCDQHILCDSKIFVALGRILHF